MKLNGLIFSHLYKCIIEFIRQNEFTKEQRKIYAPNSTSIWKAFQFDNKRKPLIFEIYLPEETDNDYLIKKKSKLGVGVDYFEDVKDEVIIHILEKKMKRESAKSLSKELQLDRIKAAVLMQYFIKENLPNHFLENEEYYHVYDEVNKKVIFKNLNRKRAQQKKEIISYSTIPRERQIVHLKSQPRFHDYTADIARYDFIKFIKKYFQLLKDENYLDAFAAWHPQHRKYTFENSIVKFKSYFNTPFCLASEVVFFNAIAHNPRKIRKSTGWGNIQDTNIFGAKSFIYFEESVQEVRTKPNFEKVKLKDFRKISAWVEEIRSKISKKDWLDVDEMSVADLLSGKLDLAISKLDSYDAHEIFGDINYVFKHQLYEVAAVYDRKHWTLCALRPVNMNSYGLITNGCSRSEIENLCSEFLDVENDHQDFGRLNYFYSVYQQKRRNKR